MRLHQVISPLKRAALWAFLWAKGLFSAAPTTPKGATSVTRPMLRAMTAAGALELDHRGGRGSVARLGGRLARLVQRWGVFHKRGDS